MSRERVACASVFAVQFKRMLSRELTQFAESGKVGTQISEYICHTFLGTFFSHHVTDLCSLPALEVPVWDLVPFLSPHPFPFSSPFSALPFVSLPCPWAPFLIQLGNLDDRCELPQRVRAEPGRQTVSDAFP